MPARGLLTMSTQEIEHVTVIRQIVEKRLKQQLAMQLLKLSKRQVIRLVKVYRKEVPAALVSKRRGQPSNNRHDDSVKRKIKELVHKHYHDFGSTLASEKLSERDQLVVNIE
jgi:predicted DNA-binding protein (UPF0251 family)